MITSNNALQVAYKKTISDKKSMLKKLANRYMVDSLTRTARSKFLQDDPLPL